MHQPVKHLSTVLTALLLVSTSNAIAAEQQSLPALHRAAIDFITAQHPPGADLDVQPDRLDPRLRLVACEIPLAAFFAPGSASVGYTTVGLRCDGARPWKLYLPTRVKLMKPVAVAVRPLARGQRLQRSDLRLERRDVGALSAGAVLDPDQILGYVTKRGVAAGRVLDLRVLQAPRLVERGRRVHMTVATQGINITMHGTALEHGAMGETVRVRNPASSRVVEGVVTGRGRVTLTASRTSRKTTLYQ